MTFTTQGTDTRETASLIGSDKVEGTPVYRSNGERVGQIELQDAHPGFTNPVERGPDEAPFRRTDAASAPLARDYSHDPSLGRMSAMRACR